VRYIFAALVALALAGPAGPGAAQQSHKPAAGEAGRALVGRPLFSADGKRIGRIIAMGVDDSNEPVLVAEIDRPLGIGSEAVAIPFNMLVRKAGRLELTITAAEVEERIAKARRDR
jgi:PRC-barrel domain